MKPITVFSRWSARLVCAAAVSHFLTSPLPAADHRDGPIFGPAAASADLNDLFIFQAPGNAAHTVLILTMSPFAGALTPATFDHRLRYEVRIDQDRNHTTELSLRASFGAPVDGVQTVTLSEIRPGRPAVTLATGQTNANLPIAGGGLFRAAIHDDPFFFDMIGFTMLADDGVGTFPRPIGQAANFFGPNVNTLALIIEVPTAALLKSADRPIIGAWMRTLNSAGVQLDRAAQPFSNQVAIPPLPRDRTDQPDRRTAFNRGSPTSDLRLFRADVVSTLGGFWESPPDRAGAIADRLLLPNVLTFDSSFTFDAPGAGFPNGRRLRDDVADQVVNLLSAGRITTDNVGDDNGDGITDGTLRGDGSVRPIAFPYLGPPSL